MFFLLGAYGFYQLFDADLDVEIRLNSTEDLRDGAGYETVTFNVTNNEETGIKPRFYLIEPTNKGPHRLYMENYTEIEPGETVQTSLKPHNYTYLTAERGQKYSIVLKDLKTGRTGQKIMENEFKIKNSTIRNTEIVSFSSKPSGWKELFMGSYTDLRFEKSMQGIEIERFPRTKISEDMGYYLIQDFNLTEYITVEAHFNNLSNTSTGIRLLQENSSPVSRDGVIEIDFTEEKEFKQNEPNRFNLRKQFKEQKTGFEPNRTMKLQFYYEGGEGGQNRFFLDRIEPTNRKT